MKEYEIIKDNNYGGSETYTLREKTESDGTACCIAIPIIIGCGLSVLTFYAMYGSRYWIPFIVIFVLICALSVIINIIFIRGESLEELPKAIGITLLVLLGLMAIFAIVCLSNGIFNSYIDSNGGDIVKIIFSEKFLIPCGISSVVMGIIGYLILGEYISNN